MANAGDSTWYKALLRREQDTNLKLVRLCEKQQQLIKHLENALEDQGANKPPAAPQSSSTKSDDVGHTTLGPNSPRLRWTGTTTDLIPVSLSGNKYRALILTSGMIKEWNKVLDISRRMRKYIKERDIAVKATNYAAHLNETEPWYDTPKGRMVAGRLVSELKAGFDFHCARIETIEDRLLDCDRDIAHGREHLEHRIRVIFKRHDILRSLDDGWLQELRDGRDTASKERAKLRDSTSIETADCDSMLDDN